MFGIGMPEMLLILAVALIVVGPKKLPDLAKSIGRSLGEFKKAARDIKDSIDPDDDLSEVKKAFDGIQRPLDTDFFVPTSEKQIAPSETTDESTRKATSDENSGESKDE